MFTIGHLPMLQFDDFIYILKSNNIDVIVDIRPDMYLQSYASFSYAQLSERLPKIGIAYHPMTGFSIVAPSAQNKKGQPLYTKVIKTATFQSAVDATNELITQGHTICFLGRESAPTQCYRYKVLGKYFTTKSVTVTHILPNGDKVTQQQLEESENHRNSRTQSNKTKALQLGSQGEEIACKHLNSHGYTILDRNYGLHYECEIDIVAFKADTIHFVEVKTRRCTTQDTPSMQQTPYSPIQAIDNHKIQNIRRAIRNYMHRNNCQSIPFQIDSISIVYDSSDNFHIQHYENIDTLSKFFHYS